MLLIPAAGSPVEGRHARGSQRAHEQQAQHRSPQRVKAIPLAPRVQGHEEEVRLLQRGKPRAALLFADPAHDGTQRSREARQDAGVQQKGLHRLRLVGEDLLAQILDQVAVRAQALGEKRTYLSLAALPLQQQRGQLQAGDPALGAAEDRGERGGLQVPLQRQVQKGAGLGEIELQISGAQLAELATRSQPRQGQAWIGAARDEQVQLGWAVLHQLGDGVLVRLVRSLISRVKTAERERPCSPCGEERCAWTLAPSEGSCVWKAASRVERKCCGSLSSASRESQTAGTPHSARNAASRVVLPKPTGAHSRMRLCERPCLRRSMRRERGTSRAGSRGT